MFLHFTFVLHVLHSSCGPAEHPFDSVSVALTRSDAVDRELPSRLAMIETGLFRSGGGLHRILHLTAENLGSEIAHATSLCQVPRIVRMSVARICAMPMSAA